LILLLLLSACDTGQNIGGMPVSEAPPRQVNTLQMALGKQVFADNCAVCHGDRAQGTTEWRQTDADGYYPPPPLNGSAHAWHHSTEVLKDVILAGSPQGQGNMPAWKDNLSDEQIDAVIVWIQSTWPQTVYDTWFEMQQRGR